MHNYSGVTKAQAQDGAAKSTLRLQLGNLKRKAKELESQVQEKDLEISRMREKTSDQAQENMKAELKRAHDVLRHLKKKVGYDAFNKEYEDVMKEIREALGLDPIEKKKAGKRRRVQMPRPPRMSLLNQEGEDDADHQIDNQQFNDDEQDELIDDDEGDRVINQERENQEEVEADQEAD